MRVYGRGKKQGSVIFSGNAKGQEGQKNDKN